MRRTIEVEVEAQIARPAEEVWAFVSDARRLPEWLEEFHSVVKRSDGTIGMGTVFRYTLEPGDRSGTIQNVEWEAGRRLAWDGPPLRRHGGAVRPRGGFEVADLGDGHTRFVSRYEPELTGTMALLAPYLKRWLRKQRLTDTERLKTLIEAQAP